MGLLDPSTPLGHLPLAIPSMTLGRAWVHSLPTKLRAAAAAGIKGIEVFWEDVVFLARERAGLDPAAGKGLLAGVDEVNDQYWVAAAEEIRALCDELGLYVLNLQPLINFDGLLDHAARAAGIEKAKLFFKLVKILGSDMIQVPTNMLSEGTTGDEDTLVRDLTELGQLAAAQDPPVRIAYETMSWGAHRDTWQDVYRVVERVNLPNVGHVLDSFQILSRVWADPSTPSLIEFDDKAKADAALGESLRELASTPGLREKTFYIQLCDGARLKSPIVPGHELYTEGQKPRMSWSRSSRLFPCEYDRGGFLPVTDVAKVLFHEIGWRGWVSFEVFNNELADPREDLPRTNANRAVESWKRLRAELGDAWTHECR